MSRGRNKTRIKEKVKASYYMPESMQLVLCGACVMVALEYSEKAREIYIKIVESYRLSDIKGYIQPNVLTTGQTWGYLPFEVYVLSV